MYCGPVTIHGVVCSPDGERGLVKPSQGAKTYGVGRHCAIEGCATVLSRYNPSSTCAMHGRGWKAELRPVTRHTQKGPERIAYCQNPRCGAEFVTSNPARKYCSDRCRMQTYQLR